MGTVTAKLEGAVTANGVDLLTIMYVIYMETNTLRRGAYLSMYIAYYLVSIPTLCAVAGPMGGWRVLL